MVKSHEYDWFTQQRTFAWPLRKDDMQICEAFQIFDDQLCRVSKGASCSALSNLYHISLCFRAVQTRPPSRSQNQVGDQTSEETKTEHKQIIIVRLIEGKKGNNLGTRQEPLRIQVNNNCLKYCDSFHLWPEALWLAERVSYLAFFWRPQRDSRKFRLNGHV